MPLVRSLKTVSNTRSLTLEELDEVRCASRMCTGNTETGAIKENEKRDVRERLVAK